MFTITLVVPHTIVEADSPVREIICSWICTCKLFHKPTCQFFPCLFHCPLSLYLNTVLPFLSLLKEELSISCGNHWPETKQTILDGNSGITFLIRSGYSPAGRVCQYDLFTRLLIRAFSEVEKPFLFFDFVALTAKVENKKEFSTS